jgi:hypothetical protein
MYTPPNWHVAAAALTFAEYVDMEVANDIADSDRKRQETLDLEEYRSFLVSIKSLHALAVERRRRIATQPMAVAICRKRRSNKIALDY